MAHDAPESPPAGAEPQLSMYAYPWDLYDPSPEAAARQLRQAGFNTVHLAMTYHVATFLLPRHSAGPVRYGNLGAAYFQPEPGRYREAGVLPPVAAEVRDDPAYMTRLLAVLAEAGLAVRAWTVYCYNHTLATARPELAKQDAFGQPYGSQLCVGNRAFRAFARSLTADILALPAVAGLFIESLCYLRYNYGFLGTKQAVEPSPRAAVLLGLCFCAGCKAAAREAGIEIEGLQRQVADFIRAELNAFPHDDQPPPADEAWQERAFDGALARLQQVRSRLAHDLLTESIEAVRQRSGRAEVMGFGGLDDAAAADVRQRLDEAVVRPQADGPELARQVAARRREYGADTRMIAAFYPGDLRDQDTFLGRLAASQAAGVDGFRVYNYGILNARQLDWLASAPWHA